MGRLMGPRVAVPILLGWSVLASAQTFSYATRHENAECGSQLQYVGVFSTAALCASEAGTLGCSSFMFSSTYTVWGCRCCSAPDGGNSHTLWDVYDVVDCSAPAAP